MKDFKCFLQDSLNTLHKRLCKYLHEIIRARLRTIKRAAGRREYEQEAKRMDKLALSLMIAGAVNWGLVGIFSFDAVAWLLGGQTSVFSRVVYILIAIAGCWGFTMFFHNRKPAREL